jgi:hypothetical protein
MSTRDDLLDIEKHLFRISAEVFALHLRIHAIGERSLK